MGINLLQPTVPSVMQLAVMALVCGRSKTFTHPVILARADCRYSEYACSPSTLSTVAAALRFVVLCVSVAMFSFFLCRTFRQLRHRPYRCVSQLPHPTVKLQRCWQDWHARRALSSVCTGQGCIAGKPLYLLCLLA